MARKSSAARAAEDNELDVDYSERNGFLTGKAAAIADWYHRKGKAADQKLYAVLRARRWVQNNPERARENNRRADAKKYARRREENAALVRGAVLTCERCGTQWCRIPMGKKTSGTTPKYCPNGCLRKAMQERAAADPARRAAAVARAVAWQQANREKHRAHCRAWARQKRAQRPTHTKETDK